MELVEAVILLLVGMVPGVWTTFADVYLHGASAFSSHVSLWLLLVMLLATNARYRRQAGVGAAALSLGYIETYYLCSSFTFAGMARSTMLPLALLAVVGAVAANVGWAAKRERGALGLALKALVVVATLVACVAAHDGVSLTDVVCTLVIAYLLLVARSRKVALERHRPRLEAGDADTDGQDARDRAVGDARGTAPDRRPRATSADAEKGDARHDTPERKGSRSRSSSRQARDRRPSASTQRGKASGSRRRRQDGRPSASSSDKRGSRAGRTPVRAAAAEGSSRGRQAASGGAGTKGSSAKAQGAKTHGRSSTRAKAQRPTRRTGGVVPEANRIRNSASDRPRQHRAAGSGGKARRR